MINAEHYFNEPRRNASEFMQEASEQSAMYMEYYSKYQPTTYRGVLRKDSLSKIATETKTHVTLSDCRGRNVFSSNQGCYSDANKVCLSDYACEKEFFNQIMITGSLDYVYAAYKRIQKNIPISIAFRTQNSKPEFICIEAIEERINEIHKRENFGSRVYAEVNKMSHFFRNVQEELEDTFIVEITANWSESDSLEMMTLCLLDSLFDSRAHHSVLFFTCFEFPKSQRSLFYAQDQDEFFLLNIVAKLTTVTLDFFHSASSTIPMFCSQNPKAVIAACCCIQNLTTVMLRANVEASYLRKLPRFPCYFDARHGVTVAFNRSSAIGNDNLSVCISTAGINARGLFQCLNDLFNFAVPQDLTSPTFLEHELIQCCRLFLPKFLSVSYEKSLNCEISQEDGSTKNDSNLFNLNLVQLNEDNVDKLNNLSLHVSPFNNASENYVDSTTLISNAVQVDQTELATKHVTEQCIGAPNGLEDNDNRNVQFCKSHVPEQKKKWFGCKKAPQSTKIVIPSRKKKFLHYGMDNSASTSDLANLKTSSVQHAPNKSTENCRSDGAVASRSHIRNTKVSSLSASIDRNSKRSNSDTERKKGHKFLASPQHKVVTKSSGSSTFFVDDCGDICTLTSEPVK